MPLSAFSAFDVLVFLVRFGAFLSVFVLFSALGAFSAFGVIFAFCACKIFS